MRRGLKLVVLDDVACEREWEEREDACRGLLECGRGEGRENRHERKIDVKRRRRRWDRRRSVDDSEEDVLKRKGKGWVTTRATKGRLERWNWASRQWMKQRRLLALLPCHDLPSRVAARPSRRPERGPCEGGSKRPVRPCDGREGEAVVSSSADRDVDETRPSFSQLPSSLWSILLAYQADSRSLASTAASSRPFDSLHRSTQPQLQPPSPMVLEVDQSWLERWRWTPAKRLDAGGEEGPWTRSTPCDVVVVAWSV